MVIKNYLIVNLFLKAQQKYAFQAKNKRRFQRANVTGLTVALSFVRALLRFLRLYEADT
jgi:hypothetical protein